MIFYIIGLGVLIIILCTALYLFYRNLDKGRTVKPQEPTVYDEETIIDELIAELIEKNQNQENEDKTAQSKEDMLTTFIELHRSGSFCSQLSEEEITNFVKKKLNMEINQNG